MNPGTPGHWMRALCLATALLGAAGTGIAETSPYYAGGSLALTHAINPFQAADGAVLPEGVSRNDNILTYELLAGIDQSFGRQRLFGSASLRKNHWQNNKQLDGSGYDLSLGLDFATQERLSGTVTIAANQALNRGDPGSTPNVYTLNLHNTDSINGVVRYGTGTNLRLFLGGGHRSVRYSSPEFAYLEYSQNDANFGVSYTQSGALTLGFGPSFARGVYPSATCRRDANGDPIPGSKCDGDTADNYNRRGLDLTAAWVPNGLSTVDARLGYYKQTNTSTTTQDSSGVNGFVNWVWTPTGKLRLTSNLSRNNGQDLYFYNLTSAPTNPLNQTDYSTFTTAASLAADYALSGKVILNSSLRYAHRTLSSSAVLIDGTLVAGTPVTDNSTTFALGATWTPTRSSQIGCNLRSDQRRSAGSAGTLPYSAGTIGCSAQLTLR